MGSWPTIKARAESLNPLGRPRYFGGGVFAFRTDDTDRMANGGLFPRREPSGSWFKDHSLSLILATLMVVQTAHAVWAGHRVWVMESRTHGDPARGWPADFWIWWSWEYNVSLVADTFGVLLIVLLTKWFYEEGSSENSE